LRYHARVTSPVHQVFLIPGFFGFDYLGDLAYFAHVHVALADWARREGVEVRVHTVRTLPTASLIRRAERVLEEMGTVLANAGPDDPVHLVGHSSGGLDARLVVTPDVALPGAAAAEPLAARVRSVVTLATPHQGTPLASFFSSFLGEQLLEALSLATSYVMRTGRLPLDVLGKLATLFVRLAAGREAADPEALQTLRERILGDFDPERRGSLAGFVELIARDQDLLPQITPATIDLFNASTQDRPGVRYGSVVTQARGPSLRGFASAGLSAYAQGSHGLYLCIGQLTARVPADRVPVLDEPRRAALRRGFGGDPGRRANDGVVPTLSQPWGEIIRAVWADHLDVIGHFNHPTHVPPHFDWLASGTGHTRAEFLATWKAVAEFLFRR
jgi:triacylglycerol lipase